MAQGGLRVPPQGLRFERAVPRAGRVVPREQVVLDHVAGRPRRLEPAETDISESGLWEPCVRDFVRGLAEPARRAGSIGASTAVGPMSQ